MHSLFLTGRNDDDEQKIRTMNLISYAPESNDISKYIPEELIERKIDLLNITNIRKRPIEKTNDGIKFFKVSFEFRNTKIKTFIVPSFVKFYSSKTASFVPVEYLKSRHILLDYEGNMVKAADAQLVDDFKMTDYYNIKVVYELDEADFDKDNKPKKCTCNFYLNGVLANVSYNNFQMKETSED